MSLLLSLLLVALLLLLFGLAALLPFLHVETSFVDHGGAPEVLDRVVDAGLVPGGKGHQSDRVGKGTLLHLLHKLGKLRVGPGAVVDLERQ